MQKFSEKLRLETKMLRNKRRIKMLHNELWLRAKMLRSEKDFQEIVITCARLCGWDYYHDSNNRHSMPGFPDLVLVRNGDLIFCELKTMTGRLSLEQFLFITALRQRQYEAYVWRPCDWTAIRQRLSAQ